MAVLVLLLLLPALVPVLVPVLVLVLVVGLGLRQAGAGVGMARTYKYGMVRRVAPTGCTVLHGRRKRLCVARVSEGDQIMRFTTTHHH